MPPLAEQKRIVAKVEELLARVNAARERLARVPAILKRFRQSILAAACSGLLTADWREKRPRNEDGHTLLMKIGRLHRSEPGEVPIGRPNDLPETWGWTTFGFVLAELRNGISTRPELEPPGHPILRISAVRSGKVQLADFRYLPNSDQLLDDYSIRDGDLLFTRYNGSIDLLGVCGMVRGVGRKTFLYPDKLMRVRFDHPHVLPAFAQIFFQGPESRDRLMGEAKSSAGQQGVSGKDIKAQAFAVPPIAEQAEIVRCVEGLFKLADAVEARVATGTFGADKLPQAILAKAFRGELVPTEAELARAERRPYEPASALLTRIQVQRDSSECTAPRRNRRR